MNLDLDEIKKLSEIFNNFAQPIVTLIAAYIGTKLVKDSKSKSKKRKGK